MAFIASTATQAQGLLQAMQQASWIKVQAQGASTMLTGNVTTTQVLQIVDNLRSSLSVFAAVSAIPGISAYAQAQFDNPTYDIAANFTVMVNAINAAVAWVVTNFPKDTGGFMQGWTLASDGSRTEAVFTPAQTASWKTLIDAVSASVA